MKRVCLIVHRQICSALGSVPIRREYALRIAGFWFVPRMPHHHERVFGTNGVDVAAHTKKLHRSRFLIDRAGGVADGIAAPVCPFHVPLRHALNSQTVVYIAHDLSTHRPEARRRRQ
ncbi:hypothetical protein [Burkholderia multivorans]|uniref:hypothetical protein n=1 Tax=Burkholderia multivorans TaxID=87883 RepID=UPI0011B2260C|nr:hypothetical protein [Burkholderia multivorans]MBU9619956.1 hypothetical protein [Burkholderia multivorans]NGM79109.1 hypothetical protein [Burkholderia multivorans]